MDAIVSAPNGLAGGFFLPTDRFKHEEVPAEFLDSLDVVMEMCSRNLVPRRPWGDDKLQISFTSGEINFISGNPGTEESGFQGRITDEYDRALRLSPMVNQIVKQRIHQGQVVHVNELLPKEFNLVYRWKNHRQGREDAGDFRWVWREFRSIGSSCTGAWESGEYRTCSANDWEWSRKKDMLVALAYQELHLSNLALRKSPTQNVFASSHVMSSSSASDFRPIIFA